MEIDLGFDVKIKPVVKKERGLEYSDYSILNNMVSNNECTRNY